MNKRIREIFTYIYPLIQKQNAPEKKFVIFGQARTGSALLGDLLNSHPEIYCDSEIFLPTKVKKLFFPYLYLKNHCNSCKKKIYGFRLKLYQLIESDTQNIDAKKFILYLHDNDWKIIYLKRDNFLRQAISASIAKDRKCWHDVSSNPLEGYQIYIDCSTLIKRIEKREILQKKYEEILRDIPYISVIYERDILHQENHQKTLDIIFDYLEINSVPVKTKFFRTTSNQIREFVQNYEEVAEVLRTTKYVSFLTD